MRAFHKRFSESPVSQASENTYVFDVTTANFEDAVIKASLTTPILVDFWASWCEPCKALSPLLDKLAAEYNGAFALAKVDVDAEQQIAAMFGIRSIPTVMLVKDGQVLDGFAGALPEGQLREFLGRHLQPFDAEEGEALEPPAAEVEAETPEAAINRLQQAIAAEPDAAGLKLDLAVALMTAGRTEAAAAELDALPANLSVDPRAVRLRSELELSKALAGAPSAAELRARVQANPADAEARDQLGVRLLLEGDPAAGMDQWLELLKTQRDWNDGAAKKRLLAAFTTLNDAELVGRYRRKMASLLF